jgi:hypothetical protein
VINELGREEPIFLLTNQLKRSAPKLITRYAQTGVSEITVANCHNKPKSLHLSLFWP